MRTATALLTATVALFATACGSSAPTVCGDAIPQQQVFVGAREQVTPCFNDPGGGALTLAAVSSNAEVVQAFLVGANVGFAGVAVGDATITVTATNEDDLSAEMSFSVLVPNRAPNYVSSMTEASVLVNRSVQWNLMDFFTDPEGEEMTFAATSSSGSVDVSVTGSVAEVFGVSEGSAQVTLTATDPHGDEGTGTVDVTVKTPVLLIEDEFDTEESLDDWTYPDDMEASVENGILSLRYPEDGFFSWAWQEVDEVTDFSIEVNMAPIEGGLTGVIWYTGSESGIPQYFLLTGSFTENRNWLLVNVPAGGGNLVVAAGGNSARIRFDEFDDYVISLSGDNFVLTVGGREAFNGTVDGAVPTMVGAGLTGENVTSDYDDVTVFGVLSSGKIADAPKTARPRMGRKIALRDLDFLIKR